MLTTKDFRIRLWGESAVFTRYDTPAEAQTYPILTPAAASGMLKCIFWHPGLEWEIRRIEIINPVHIYSRRFKNLSTLPKKSPIDIKKHHTLKLQHVIDRPEYVVTAHLVISNSAPDKQKLREKYEYQVAKRLRQGRCYEQPYFGQREHLAYFEEASENTVPWAADADLGPLPAYFYYVPSKNGGLCVKKHVYEPATGEWVPHTFQAEFRATFVEGTVRNGELYLQPYLPEF